MCTAIRGRRGIMRVPETVITCLYGHKEMPFDIEGVCDMP